MTTSGLEVAAKETSVQGASHVRQVVVFRLAEGSYGLDIQVVREINRLTDVTVIPKAPSFVEGIINLRGTIVPVVNLGLRFGMTRTEHSKDARVVVIEASDHTIGLVVDEVSEVLRIPEEDIDPATNVSASGISVDYVTGVGKIGDRLILILSLEKLFTSDERSALQEISQG